MTPRVFTREILQDLVRFIFCNINILINLILQATKMIGKNECPVHFGCKDAIFGTIYRQRDHF